MQISVRYAILAGLLLSCIAIQAVVAGVAIERYQKDRDREAILHILRDEPSLTYESLGKPAGTTEEYLESPQYSTKVLRVDGRTAGFINYHVQTIAQAGVFLDSFGFIAILGVAAQYRRRGFGKQLLNHAISELVARNVSRVVLGVKSSNMAARRLYESAGFDCLIPAQMQDSVSELMYELRVISAKTLPQGEHATTASSS